MVVSGHDKYVLADCGSLDQVQNSDLPIPISFSVSLLFRALILCIAQISWGGSRILVLMERSNPKVLFQTLQGWKWEDQFFSA